ncbi:sugar-binding domain-containing protein [Bacillus solitudinis]|uniref:sugar-binding domain-containing protein n=1 Tax=Bacillus solitudinis TaxID=2014074 RepID=UPI000C23DE60|nr:sugar-binding domain-containing protein [Bacillus solitudinis]
MFEIRKTQSLNGTWTFKLDPANELNVKDILSETNTQETIVIPGSWEEQGYGESSKHYPIGTWKKLKEYVGGAWYCTECVFPVNEKGSKTVLKIAGAHWFTKLWIDEKFVGEGESLVSDHIFNVSEYIRPGQQQKVVIHVDNCLHIPLMESHIHSYHTATNWGGITGGVTVEVLPETFIEEVVMTPGEDPHLLNLTVHISSTIIKPNGEWSLEIHADKVTSPLKRNIHFQNQTCTIHACIDFGVDAQLWSDEKPFLYQASMILKHENQSIDFLTKKIGLRQFQIEGKHFLLNKKPVFLRGYVDCCIFPLTGYPVWDKQYYLKQFRLVKEYGFNHIRLHGWTAPKPFWEAADEEGMLVQTELPHWSFHYTDRNTPPPKEVNEFLHREWRRILQELNEHPSFVMLAPGNELIDASGHEELNQLVQIAREIDSSRVYTDNTGFGQLPAHDREGDYYIQSLNWHQPYTLDYAGSPDTREDYRELPKLDSKPLIGHEHGQFTTYIDPTGVEKYSGVLKPSWLETFNESIEAKGWSNRVPEFKKASGIHTVRAYKEIIERARRTKGLSGMQLLDIRDFPGQGHATTGVLDVFGDSKGLIKANEYRCFNNDRVLLMRSDRRTFFGGETIEVEIDVSNYGTTISTGRLIWTAISEGGVQKGELSLENVKAGDVSRIATINFQTERESASRYLLEVSFEVEGQCINNQWEFWSFPRKSLPKEVQNIWTNIPSMGSFLYGAKMKPMIGIEERSYVEEKQLQLAITDQLSRDVLQYLMDGGNVWLMTKPEKQYDEVMTQYLPIFWNFLWFPTQESTTMGMLIHNHPLMKKFPHDGYSNWQWFHLVNGAAGIGMDLIPQVKPIVEIVDNFNRMKKLSYAFEATVGRGKLFVSSFKTYDVRDLKRPESSYLFLSITKYLLSEDFQPLSHLSVGELLRVFKVNGDSVT